MGKHTTIEATAEMSGLIDLALAGETVVITRGGAPMVELKRVEASKPLKRVTPEGLAMLDRLRVRLPPAKEDAATLVSRMRDEDWR